MARVGNLLLVCRYNDGTYRLYRRAGASFIQVAAQALPEPDRGNGDIVFGRNGYIYVLGQEVPESTAGSIFSMSEANLAYVDRGSLSSTTPAAPVWHFRQLGGDELMTLCYFLGAETGFSFPVRITEVNSDGTIDGEEQPSFSTGSTAYINHEGSKTSHRYLAIAREDDTTPLIFGFRREDNETWWWSSIAVVWTGAAYAPLVMEWNPDNNYLFTSSGLVDDATFSIFEREGVHTSQTLTEVYRSPIGPGKIVNIAAQQNFIAVAYEIDDGSITYRTDLFKRYGNTVVKVGEIDDFGRLLQWSLDNLLFDASVKKVYERVGNDLIEQEGMLDNVALGAIRQGVSDHVDSPLSTSSFYNDAVSDLVMGNIDFEAVKVLLLDDSASFSPSDSTVDAVTGSGAYEVFGANWPEGGVTLTNVEYVPEGGMGVRLAADNVSQEIFGGSITARAALIYQGTQPLIYIDFGEDRTIPNSTEALLDFGLGGIAIIST